MPAYCLDCCETDCRCNPYRFTVGQWLEFHPDIQITSQVHDVIPERARIVREAKPAECEARELRAGKPWYKLHGYYWPEYALLLADMSRIPSDNPAHVCGMFCDGQDGRNSDCARAKRRAQKQVEKPAQVAEELLRQAAGIEAAVRRTRIDPPTLSVAPPLSSVKPPKPQPAPKPEEPTEPTRFNLLEID